VKESRKVRCGCPGFRNESGGICTCGHAYDVHLKDGTVCAMKVESAAEPKRRRGRPSVSGGVGPSPRLYVAVSPATYAALEENAERTARRPADVARAILDGWAEDWRAAVEKAPRPRRKAARNLRGESPGLRK